MTTDDAGAVDSVLYFEDLSVGDTFPFGSHTVTREEIVSFAEKYDPQEFHLQDSGHHSSVFDGLVASGWHTVSLSNRMIVEDVFDKITTMGGSGVDNLRWPTPVYPGDTLSGEATIAALNPSSHELSGKVNFDVVVVNNMGETVLSYCSHGIVRRNPAATSE